MNRFWKIGRLAAAAGLLWSGALGAEDRDQQLPLAIEIDPATYALNGYALHLRFDPEILGPWVAGFGAYGLDFPKALVNSNPQNRDQGWNLRLHSGAGLFLERYFSPEKDGWFLGLQLSRQNYRLENSDRYRRELELQSLAQATVAGYDNRLYLWQLYRRGEQDLLLLHALFPAQPGSLPIAELLYIRSNRRRVFSNGLAMIYGGYRIYPGKQRNIYLQFWGGVGYTETVAGTTSLRGKSYDVAPTVPFATVHIGYHF
ncbi:MAG: hypothetical protein K1X75_07445 [Leptospirales bacterium]|nr:hypothetical protein [Leptospirales bacterium]